MLANSESFNVGVGRVLFASSSVIVRIEKRLGILELPLLFGLCFILSIFLYNVFSYSNGSFM